MTQAIVALASQYGRYGYRRITALLQREGWHVGKDRVERIWRREGLKVPQKQKPRGRLWFNNGSCVRLRPTHKNHVWSYDFVSVRTHNDRTARVLNLIDEHTREALMVAKTMYIEPGSPWENGYCESFNSKLRDEFLNGEIFYSILELRVLAERWRVHYNTVRPHSSLGYKPPAPEAWLASTAWQPSELRERCATLTKLLVQNIGQANPAFLPPLAKPPSVRAQGFQSIALSEMELR